MNIYNKAASLLPMRLYSEILAAPENLRLKSEEIRLRAGQAPSLLCEGVEYRLGNELCVSQDDLDTVLEKATGASVHSYENSIANAYISVDGGIRIGICGTAVMDCGTVCGIRSLSSLAIRIPHDISDCADELYSEHFSGRFKNTLLISPPGCGKTTLMRSLIKNLSYAGMRVSVADERGELGAVYEGEAQYDLGPCTDIMSFAPKSEAALMMLRAMNTQVLAVDEISASKDVRALIEAFGCGINILASAHASGVSDLYKRPVYRELMNAKMFEYIIIISAEHGIRNYVVKEINQ